MHLIDWAFLVGLVLFVLGISWYTQRYVKGVASFLSADRCAGRYLLAVAQGMANLCAISIIAFSELYYKAGFVPKFWEMFLVPIGLIISLTGWVVYRFRETRAMTLAQFFEMRYNRKFRIFSGLIAYFAGIINFGIFPSVGTRFLIYFCDLPVYQIDFFGFTLNITFAIVMLILLGVSLFVTFSGGQITVMVTDFFQGSFFTLVSLAVIAYFIFYFQWSQVEEALRIVPLGESKVNPFDTSGEREFGLIYFVIAGFAMSYTILAWQGTQGYMSSAKNAHEQKMAGVLGQWRGYVLLLIIIVPPIFMYVLMHHPDFIDKAGMVNAYLDERISTDPHDTIRIQMLVPVALKTVLPVGLTGLMAAAVLCAFISTHSTYLHSWGVIFVQDVIMPFRKTPFSKDQHLRVLRWSVVGVAVFIFLFSLIFRQSTYIILFFAITGAIYMGGAGSCIIGGLYWKRGSTAAAFSALSFGAILGIIGVILQNYCSGFPLNGQEMYFVSIVSSIIVYVVVSLCGRTSCNMDKLLNRGRYAIVGESHLDEQMIQNQENFFKRQWRKLITKDFTWGDKLLYASTLVWSLGWLVVAIVSVLVSKIRSASGNPLTDDYWFTFWKLWVWAQLILGIAIAIWLLIGGFKNLIEMHVSLQRVKVNERDDGWVSELKIDDDINDSDVLR